MFSRLRAFFKYIRDNQFDRSLMKYFDWPLFLIVMGISIFGVVCIFSATSSQVTEYPANVVEMLQTQSTLYPRLQLMWIGAGLVAMAIIIFFPYDLYGQYANAIYAANIGLLLFTLLVAPVGGRPVQEDAQG